MSQKLINKANQLRDAGKTDEAKKILTPLLKSKDYQIVVNANDALGICHMNADNFDSAVKYYKKALDLSKKKNWHERLPGITRNLGIAYRHARKFKKSEQYMLESVCCSKKYQKKGNWANASIGITYSKLGLTYTHAKKYKEAEWAFEKAFRFLNKSNHYYWNLIAGIDKSYFLVAVKKYRKAEGELEELISNAIKQNKEYKLIEALILAGDAKRGLKNKEEAEMFYNLARLALRIFDSPQVVKKFKKEINKR